MASDLIERLKLWSDPAEYERHMVHWDGWRKYIKEGGGGSWPRDAFESLLDAFAQDASEAAAALATERERAEKAEKEHGAAVARFRASEADAELWQIQVERAEAALSAFDKERQTPEGWKPMREDAERWRALMSSQRMHFMGCAGIDLVNKPGTTGRKTADLIPVMRSEEYQHFGMEFWSEHSAFGNPEFPDDFERSLLVAYVDHLRAGRALLQSTEGQ